MKMFGSTLSLEALRYVGGIAAKVLRFVGAKYKPMHRVADGLELLMKTGLRPQVSRQMQKVAFRGSLWPNMLHDWVVRRSDDG